MPSATATRFTHGTDIPPGMVNPLDCIPAAEFESTLAAFEQLLGTDREVAGVLVDVDGVLVRVDGSHPPPVVGENVDLAVRDRLADVHERYGACLVTNRIKLETFDPDGLESVFGVPVVRDAAPKPGRGIFEAGLELLGVPWTDRGQVVLVGDSSYYDAWGAGRLGIQVYQIDQDRRSYPLHQMLGKRAADGVQTTCKRLQAAGRRLPSLTGRGGDER